MLPVTQEFLASLPSGQDDRSRCELLIIQHILPDTEQFILLLSRHGFRIRRIVAIPYSTRPESVDRLRANGHTLLVPAFELLDATASELVHTEIHRRAECRDVPLVIHEVGGYCAISLSQLQTQQAAFCLGVVEETKQGLWRYAAVPRLPVPVLQIADSRLKYFESYHIGEAVSLCVDEDATHTGRSLAQLRVAVLGYGDIGTAVARSVRSRGAKVECFDTSPYKSVRAGLDGFRCPERSVILAGADVVVGATGARSLHPDDLPNLKDGVVLTSASSRDVEFPVPEISRGALDCVSITPHVTAFRMPWGKSIWVANGGFPVNFRHTSLPAAFADLMFCQITSCLVRLISESPAPGLHGMTEADEERIAALWRHHYRVDSTAPS